MKAALPEPQIVTKKGRAVAVILPIDTYKEMLERLEDAADIEWLKKTRLKPTRFRSLDDYLADRSRKRSA